MHAKDPRTKQVREQMRRLPVPEAPVSFDTEEIIQLTELAVRGRLPPYATEDDMYAALDRCGMKVSEIFSLLDLAESAYVRGQAADVIKSMLFKKFDRCLLDVTAHRVPL
jgi:hypothetical protein